MSWAVFRAESAVHGLRFMLPLAVVLGFLLAVLTGTIVATPELAGPGEARPEASLEFGLPYAMLLVLGLQLVFIGARFLPLPIGGRPTLRGGLGEFELSLPVEPRVLSRTRLVATAVALVLPIGVAALVPSVRALGTPAAPVVARAGLAVAALVLLFVAALFGPLAHRLSGWRVVLALGIGGLVLVAVPWLLPEHSVLVAVVYTLAAIALALHGERNAGADAPPVVRRADRGEADPAETPRLPTGSALRWVLIRSTLLRPSILAFLFFLCVFAAGLVEEEQVWINLYFVPFFALFTMRWALGVLRGLDALPLSRGRIAPWVLLPSLAVIVAGVAMGHAAGFGPEFVGAPLEASGVRVDRTGAEVLGGERQHRMHVRVPPESWRFHRSGEPPVITAPWGETVRPELHPVFWGAPWSVYNPYDVSEASSVRFAAWQVGRALEDHHGVVLGPDEVNERFLEEDPDATVGEVRLGLRAGEEPLLAGLARPRHAVAFSLLLGGLLWFVAALLLTWPNTPPRNHAEHRRRVVRNLVLSVLGAAGILSAYAMDLQDEVLVPVFMARLRETFGSVMPASPVLSVLIVAALLIGLVLVAARRLRGLETPAPVKRGWSGSEMSAF